MKDSHKKEIGERLRKLRTELHLTREQLAELADISPGYYAQLEVGSSQMSLDTLIKLKSSLHVSFEYLLLGKEREFSDPAPIINLLHQCSDGELRLAETVLKLFLMKNSRI